VGVRHDEGLANRIEPESFVVFDAKVPAAKESGPSGQRIAL
jgi:hypothetical protein